jgi:phospholipid/cholesterol/gamma-HCH transport system substrate-binding protein
MRRRPPRNTTLGLIALAVALVLVYLGFTKDLPFTTPYQVNAVFESANSIRPGSPVRIAGVEVGKVKEIKPHEGTDAAVVVLQIDEDGLPLHADATAKIRPRIFLEGNFFVDLESGSPGAEELEDGGTLKVTQTASPVQLDEVLTALQSDTREDLKDLLEALAVALNSKPTAAENRDADPLARGQTAAESFNDAYDDIPAAERSTAQVLEAILGTEPSRDLSRLIDGTARTTAALARNENALQGLIGNLNVTMAAFASEADNLRTSIAELPGTLDSANGALASLNAAFPPTRAFAREILPGVRETPATIEAAFPWIAQARPLMGPRELGGVARELSPTTADLARLTDRAITLLPQTTLASRCARDVILPTGDVVIQDEFTTGVENYKEFLYTLVGLSGEGQNFDANGMYVRFQPGGGSQQVSLGSQSSSSGELFGNNVAVPLGNRPFYPGSRSPYRPDAPCHQQRLPELNGPAAAKSAPTGQAAAARAARNSLPLLQAKLRPFGTRDEAKKKR